MKNYLKFSIKAIISLSILVFILSSIDFLKLKSLFIELNFYYLAFSVIIIYFGILISSLKWQILLYKQDLDISLNKAVSAYYSGMFFNSFLPSIVGGDFIRAKIINADKNSLNKSLMSVVFERYLGVIALSFLALIGVIVGLKFNYPSNVVFMASLIFIAILIVSLIFFVFWDYLTFKRNLSRWKIGKILSKYYDSLLVYRKFSKDIFKAVLLSFLFQFLSILYIFVIAKSLGISVSIWYLFLIVPLVTLFLMLPISINGIGLRETAFIFFFSHVGLSATSAVAISFLSFSVLVIISSVGGIVFLLNRQSK